MTIQEQGSKGIFLSIDWMTIMLYVILIVWGWFSVCGACYDFNRSGLVCLGIGGGNHYCTVGDRNGLSVCILRIVVDDARCASDSGGHRGSLYPF